MESRTSNYLILTCLWKCLVSGECPHFLPSPRNSSTPTPADICLQDFIQVLDHSTVTTYTIDHTSETSSTLEPFHAAESSPLSKKSKLSPELLNYSLNTMCSLGTKVCLHSQSFYYGTFQTSKTFILCVYVGVPECMHVHRVSTRARRGQNWHKISRNWNYRWLQGIIWVLATHPGFSVRAVCDPNCQAVAPVLSYNDLWTWRNSSLILELHSASRLEFHIRE